MLKAAVVHQPVSVATDVGEYALTIVHCCVDDTVVLQEENDGRLFTLNNSPIMSMGNAVNITCIDPKFSTEAGYSYDILAKSKFRSLKLHSFPKNVHKATLAIDSSEFLVIPNSYFSSSDPLKLEICITPKMKIFVETLSGKVITLMVESSDAIANVKERILDKEGFPVNKQRLHFDNQQLDDSQTLSKFQHQRDVSPSPHPLPPLEVVIRHYSFAPHV